MSIPRAEADAHAADGEAPRLGLIRRRSRDLMKRGPSTRLAPLAAVAAICVAAVVFGVLLEQVILAQSAFKMSRIREQMAVAEDANQALLLQMTKLSSPARIEGYARTQLGMVQPTAVEYLVANVGPSDRQVALFRRPGARRPARGQAAAGTEEGLR